jgi:hypothetical protein
MEGSIMVRVGASAVKTTDDLQGFDQVKPGRYHVMVNAVDDSFEKSDKSIIVDFEILAGTNPSEVNKTIKEYIAVSDEAVKRPVKFALATGLMQESDLGKDLDIDFQKAINRQCVVDVEEHEFTSNRTGKQVKGSRISFLGFHKLGSEDAKGVPLDAEAVKMAGGISIAGQNGGKGANGNGAAGNGSIDVNNL